MDAMSSSSPEKMHRSGPPEPNRLSIFLLARSLEVGGTERQVVALAKGLHDRGHDVRVGLFYAGGALAEELANRGIDVVNLGKAARSDVLRFMIRAAAILRRTRPDIIYSFLGGPNVAAAFLKPLVPNAKLVWSVRNSSRDLSVDNNAARVSFRLEALLARSADAIIANSTAGREFALRRGFPVGRLSIVPNGIDTRRFQVDSRARENQRRALALTENDIAIGVLGRLNSTKDYPTFLHAAARVAVSEPRAKFLCVGSGPELEPLRHMSRELGIAERVLFTGELDAVSALSAFDIACSPSITEGFSNAIAEAMACGLPCIVTNAGDSAKIVGEVGTVIPTSDPEALARAIEHQITTLPGHDRAAARDRVVSMFSVDAMVSKTLDVFYSLGGSRAERPHPALEHVSGN